MNIEQDKAILSHAGNVIDYCERVLDRHHTIALDNIAPDTDYVWPAHQMMHRLGMRAVCGEGINGRPFVVVDCRRMSESARRMAETKRQMLDKTYGEIKGLAA